MNIEQGLTIFDFRRLVEIILISKKSLFVNRCSLFL